jgi:hypothetical protein
MTISKAMEDGLEMISAFRMPSAFQMRTNTGTLIVGTIKEADMEEPIPVYYVKHGTAGLSDVYLIGIKECPSEDVTLGQGDFMSAGQTAAEVLKTIMFPIGAMRVTPIALFRKLW